MSATKSPNPRHARNTNPALPMVVDVVRAQGTLTVEDAVRLAHDNAATSLVRVFCAIDTAVRHGHMVWTEERNAWVPPCA